MQGCNPYTFVTSQGSFLACLSCQPPVGPPLTTRHCCRTAWPPPAPARQQQQLLLRQQTWHTPVGHLVCDRSYARIPRWRKPCGMGCASGAAPLQGTCAAERIQCAAPVAAYQGRAVVSWEHAVHRTQGQLQNTHAASKQTAQGWMMGVNAGPAAAASINKGEVALSDRAPKVQQRAGWVSG